MKGFHGCIFFSTKKKALSWMIAVEDVASEYSDHRPVLKDFVLWELSSGSGCCLYLSFLWMEEFYLVFFNLVTKHARY